MCVYADRSWEVSQGFYYEIREQRRVVTPRTAIAWITPAGQGPQFRVLEAEKGELIGVLEAGRPEEILVLHDFRSGESWPYERAVNTKQAAAELGERLLARLRRACPNTPYALADEP